MLYYSAKMILKFHRQYEKGNSDLEHIYEQWKQLHELRKILSDIKDKSVRDESSAAKGHHRIEAGRYRRLPQGNWWQQSSGGWIQQ